jgi:hypothetical protein
MAIEVFNRYEKKFLMDYVTWRQLQNSLTAYMEPDKHNKNGEYYTINNIYYDTVDNELIRKSISKPKYKEKLRLRGYGTPNRTDKVYLEIKKKVNGLVNKRRTTLILDEAYKFIHTKRKPLYKDYMNKQVLNELEYFLNLYELKPKICISYDRMGFFSTTDKDLRVTFDTNIRTRRYDLKLESGTYGEKLLNKNIYLVEIKTDKAFPVWLTNMLSNNKIYKNRFSKYGTEYKYSKFNNVDYREVAING